VRTDHPEPPSFLIIPEPETKATAWCCAHVLPFPHLFIRTAKHEGRALDAFFGLKFGLALVYASLRPVCSCFLVGFFGRKAEKIKV
jgi:hypothetical protein